MFIKKISLLLLFTVFATGITAQDLSFNLSVLSPKQTEPMLIAVYVSGAKIAMQPLNMGAPGTFTVLVDNDKGKQYMLMNANGQKMAMPVNMNSVEKASQDVKEPKVTITKESKTIDGRKCTKIITETDEHKADVWITQDIGMQYAEFYKMLNNTKGPQGTSFVKIPELKSVKGFPLEISSTDKKKQETVNIKIKNVSTAKVDQKLFSTEGYQMLDPGSPKH